MSYVLVSLVGQGDEATQASDAFARWYAEQHPPAERFHGDSPEHAAVAAALVALEAQRGFVLGHGGPTLRALPGPGPLDFFQHVAVWADPAQFAAMFKGARVYVYACSTLAAGEAESFGRVAVDLGIVAYAGHFQPVHAPDVGDIGLHDVRLRRAIARVVKLFLEGCDDVERLLVEARSAISRGARVRLRRSATSFNDPDLPLDWSLDWQRILGSLKVELPRP
ncbi:MAG: hypothetical protein ABI193_08720 [Minicystis sp.]